MQISRRGFIQSSSLTTTGLFLSLTGLLENFLTAAEKSIANQNRCFADGQTFYFPSSNDVALNGLFGTAYAKSLQRLGEAPIDSVDFILADVNFNQNRRFTNYSGDISGRYIEITSLTSHSGKLTTAILPELIDKLVEFQKEDGHFGADVDWNKTVDLAASTDQSLEMPILWGNGRLLLGLLAAYERFGNEKALEAAKKLADFYVNIVVKRFCDPNRMTEYEKKAAGYAAAYVTCVFHGMEGLVRAWRITEDKKYLDTAIQMADFHEHFDVLPVGHSHGSISAHEALLMIYEETGEKKYLDRVTQRWEKAVSEGYINPCGGVSEKFEINYPSDEGCSEADWLRLNLMLWRNTRETKYIDFAERMLFNAYLANQWATGGFGHRRLGVDEKGVFSWQERYAESYWCCSYHGPLGYYEWKQFLAVGAEKGQNNDQKKMIYYNFPVAFRTPIQFSGEKWTLESDSLAEKLDKIPVKTRVSVVCSENATSTIDLALRIPDWAEKINVKVKMKGNSNEKEFSSQASEIQKGEGYFVLSDLESGSELTIEYVAFPILEDRRFHRIETIASEKKPIELSEVVLRYGPDIYISKNNDGSKIEDLELESSLDSNGNRRFSIPDSLSCISKMSDEERDGKHSFVFNVRCSK
ncbi:MAG: glycoside hydrolase family 127 protein [Planctomycetia bacterium]|nr:glycoside hydrolase family 127 protein [Planctomycetia bacterium]